MNIRKATEKDISLVAAIYEHIHDNEEAGLAIIGWKRAIYPTIFTARESVADGDLFVMEDSRGRVVASAKINQVQVPEYINAPWKYDAKDSEVMVLHTLVVDPEEGGKGYGKAFVQFYEEYALSHDCHYLRMDTNEINVNARKLYKELGYLEPGIVDCIFNGIEGVHLVCLEKKV